MPARGGPWPNLYVVARKRYFIIVMVVRACKCIFGGTRDERIDISWQYLSPIRIWICNFRTLVTRPWNFNSLTSSFFYDLCPWRVRECRCRATSYNLIQISTVPVERLCCLLRPSRVYTSATNVYVFYIVGILNLFVLSFPRDTNNLLDTQRVRMR